MRKLGEVAWRVLAATGLGATGCTTVLGINQDYHPLGTGNTGGSGTGGSGPASSSGGTGGSLACIPLVDARCVGNQPQSCDANGEWQNAPACVDKTCNGGACVGSCGPGDKQCAGDTPQSCDANGAWQSAPACGGQTPVCGAGACLTPPSCAGLPATCGPAANESCCASRVVPGGTYNRSNDASYAATVSDFRLDRFEITVGRFRKFVAGYPGDKPAANAGAHPAHVGSGWDATWTLPADQAALKAAVSCPAMTPPLIPTWTDVPGANEDLPLNCINWYEAFAFCAWDGGRLPTEAEWNYAAAGGGGNPQRDYPWGNTAPDGSLAVYCQGGSCTFNVVRVGSKSPAGDGKWGQADLAGGMYEWNLDTSAAYVTPCDDCATFNIPAGAKKVIRGGSWFYGATLLTSYDRSVSDLPTYHGDNVGARCAR